MTLRQCAASRLDGARDCRVGKYRADRLVTAGQALADGDEIRRDMFLFVGKECAGAAHSTHDFIGDEEDLIAIADFADSAKVPRNGCEASGGRSADKSPQ